MMVILARIRTIRLVRGVKDNFPLIGAVHTQGNEQHKDGALDLLSMMPKVQGKMMCLFSRTADGLSVGQKEESMFLSLMASI